MVKSCNIPKRISWTWDRTPLQDLMVEWLYQRNHLSKPFISLVECLLYWVNWKRHCSEPTKCAMDRIISVDTLRKPFPTAHGVFSCEDWQVLVKVRFTKASDQGQYWYSHVKTCGIMINKSKNSHNYRIMEWVDRSWIWLAYNGTLVLPCLINIFGQPLGANHKASSMWDGVEERMRRRLALWKRQYLSKGGRTTLIKSTLASIPIYQFSLFRMPKLVAKRLEKLQRDFLWWGGSLERKIHLINWEVVCTQKEKGGLGIRKIDLLNKGLLGKWIWRFALEKEILWKKVIGVKCHEGFGWRTNEARGMFGVGVWKEILKETNWCWDNIG